MKFYSDYSRSLISFTGITLDIEHIIFGVEETDINTKENNIKIFSSSPCSSYFTIMSQSTQNNNGPIQRPQNIGGSQSANSQFQRLQNADDSIAIQKHTDLVNGTYPFTETQDAENQTQPSIQFPTMLFLGSSFP
ncbi:hypothetical protein C2G38_2166825 [Gigaspora rosea]|uniref:Uncharacterized protein n=1 Tax=Gigaspora rosea TaxID=44941 RepID=A0A397VYL3_9GLOM|nr:hypothetical protein C2G38_2166825 [Gigaspora rosea]